MGTKMLLPNQHTPLHFIYGQNDCCLCRTELRIAALEIELAQLKNTKAADCKKPIVDDPVAFAKSVHPYYVNNLWTWYLPKMGGYCVPTVEEIAEVARKNLNSLSASCHQTDSGGISAYVDSEGNYRLKHDTEIFETAKKQRRKEEEKENKRVECVVEALRKTVRETADKDGCWDVYAGAKAVLKVIDEDR